MKNYYIVQIFGERDLNLISKYINEKMYWKDTKELFLKFNPYLSDMNLTPNSPIVLIFDFDNLEVEYTYPIQFEYHFKKLSNKNKNKVKKMYFDEFFQELRNDFVKKDK